MEADVTGGLRLFKVESITPAFVGLTRYYTSKAEAKRAVRTWTYSTRRMPIMVVRRGPDHRRGETGVTRMVGPHHVIVQDGETWLVWDSRFDDVVRYYECPVSGRPMYDLDTMEGSIPLPRIEDDGTLARDGRAMSLETIAAIRRSNRNRN